MKDLLSDPRPIRTVLTGSTRYAVGFDRVTEIAVYPEPAEYCSRPWFLVKRDGGADVRVNGAQVESVEYQRDPNDPIPF